MGLTEAEVAQRAGTTPARVRELVEVGVLSPGADPDRPFRSGDALRVQLVEELAACGLEPARVADALSRGALSLSYLDWFPDPPPRSGQTHAELCEQLAIPFRLLERVYAGFKGAGSGDDRSGQSASGSRRHCAPGERDDEGDRGSHRLPSVPIERRSDRVTVSD